MLASERGQNSPADQNCHDTKTKTDVENLSDPSSIVDYLRSLLENERADMLMHELEVIDIVGSNRNAPRLKLTSNNNVLNRLIRRGSPEQLKQALDSLPTEDIRRVLTAPCSRAKKAQTIDANENPVKTERDLAAEDVMDFPLFTIFNTLYESSIELPSEVNKVKIILSKAHEAGIDTLRAVLSQKMIGLNIRTYDEGCVVNPPCSAVKLAGLQGWLHILRELLGSLKACGPAAFENIIFDDHIHKDRNNGSIFAAMVRRKQPEALLECLRFIWSLPRHWGDDTLLRLKKTALRLPGSVYNTTLSQFVERVSRTPDNKDNIAAQKKLGTMKRILDRARLRIEEEKIGMSMSLIRDIGELEGYRYDRASKGEYTGCGWFYPFRWGAFSKQAKLAAVDKLLDVLSGKSDSSDLREHLPALTQGRLGDLARRPLLNLGFLPGRRSSYYFVGVNDQAVVSDGKSPDIQEDKESFAKKSRRSDSGSADVPESWDSSGAADAQATDVPIDTVPVSEREKSSKPSSEASTSSLEQVSVNPLFDRASGCFSSENNEQNRPVCIFKQHNRVSESMQNEMRAEELMES